MADWTVNLHKLGAAFMHPASEGLLRDGEYLDYGEGAITNSTLDSEPPTSSASSSPDFDSFQAKSFSNPAEFIGLERYKQVKFYYKKIQIQRHDMTVDQI